MYRWIVLGFVFAVGPVVAEGTGKFSIETNPKGAVVSFDGNPVGKSPVKKLAVTSGGHTVQYKNTVLGQTVEFHLSIRADRHMKCFFDFATTEHRCSEENLKPSKAEGSIELISNQQAEVTMDGKKIGKTPMPKFKVPAGKHKFQFQSGNSEPVYRDVEIHENEHLKLEVSFEASKAAPDSKSEPAPAPTEAP